ncbi:MAG TPA: hypothetical protein VFQ53_39210 [Kofleriaceae bacterium]|nr:hypothetical protein [Kofleriaceae bacterium]
MFGACVDPATETDEATPDLPSDIDETAVPRLSANALAPSSLMNAQLNPDILTQANLDQMNSTLEGQRSLPYVIGCALPTGTTVTTQHWDAILNRWVTDTYSGEIGLAPNWQTTAMTQAVQRFVTACVMSRTNNNSTTMTISIRGGSTQLAVTSQEATDYWLQEGAFFGNAFQGKDYYFGACKGSGNTTATGRDCAKPGNLSGDTPCGYKYAGLCADICLQKGSYFYNCAAPNAVTYANPVSSYLTN